MTGFESSTVALPTLKMPPGAGGCEMGSQMYGDRREHPNHPSRLPVLNLVVHGRRLRRDVHYACGLRGRPSTEKTVQDEAGISLESMSESF